MNQQSKQISDLARQERIAFKKHSLLRMYERKIHADEVKIVLEHGEIIEQYPADHPLPSYLIWGHLSKNKIIHVVVALDVVDQMLWVITVYVPDPDEWADDYKRRRRQWNAHYVMEK